MARTTRLQAKRKREAAIKDWKWLLRKSDIAHDKIHPELGAVWTSVLKEACCVRNKGKKVKRLHEDVKEPLRLWPKKQYGVQHDFEDMLVTVPLLEWCVRRKYKPNAATFYATARGGDWDAVRWLRKHECPWDGYVKECYHNASAGAAKGGHLHVLKYLHENGCPRSEWTCFEAASRGHLAVLKYAHENGCAWDVATCYFAAKGGHLDVLKYAHENGCPWNVRTCYAAARGGHLRVLKYLHENGCPWDESTCIQAAKGGHLDVLKYAHENGCPWSVGWRADETCRAAAEGGHLEVLKYAHENGGPWNEGTCEAAARGGHLDVLKYAHENGCPWDETTHVMACFYGHTNVKRWALAQGCPVFTTLEDLEWWFYDGDGLDEFDSDDACEGDSYDDSEDAWAERMNNLLDKLSTVLPIPW